MKKNNFRSVLCLVSFLYSSFLCADNNGQSAKQSGKRVFLELTQSNTMMAIVSLQTNIPKNRINDIYISTNTVLRSFYNEEAFGERWILEGWSKDDLQKEVLYDTHQLFKAKTNKKKVLQKEAEQITVDKLKSQLSSTNENERKYASKLLWATWDISGGSRRSVERARDISVQHAMRLIYEIPENVKNLQLKHGGAIRYIQLRIEPVGTNTMDVLTSNVIDLQGQSPPGEKR